MTPGKDYANSWHLFMSNDERRIISIVDVSFWLTALPGVGRSEETGGHVDMKEANKAVKI